MRQVAGGPLSQTRREPRQNLEEVPHYREVGDGVDGRFGVGVDRDDGLCGANTRQCWMAPEIPAPR